MRTIALRISPRDAEVPSSTLSADEMQGADFSTRSASSISRWDETGCASDRFESPLRPRSPSSRTPGRVTWGLLSSLGGFVIRIRIPCIAHVSCMYPACILMCPVHIHQDTSRYIEIHLYLDFGHHRKCILPGGICILL